MSSIVTSILSSTVSLLVNKVRDKTADSLRGGDVADVKIRQLIVRELSDVKAKLDGLSRKDLLSSYILLKQGVDLLNASLDKSKPKAVLGATQEDGGETSKMPSDVRPDILNEALELSSTMGNLKIVSDSQFESAKKRFEEARGRATDAFSNDALEIEDRLMAAKLHIVATILENLESPETAIVACLSFLIELHGLEAVQETFSVYLYGGIKAMLNKSERRENVKSVMLINYVLCQFVSKFSSNRSFVFSCPAIELDDDRCFHPILHWLEVSTRKSVGDELTQHPNGIILDEVIQNTDLSAVNSHGETIVTRGGCKLEVIRENGKTEVDKLDAGEQVIYMVVIAGLAVDNNNNVYVVRWFKIYGKIDNTYGLIVLDENYNPKHEFTLDFLNPDIFTWVSIAISGNNNIIMTKHIASDPYVYVSANTGELKYKFDRHASLPGSLSISRRNEIMITFKDGDAVYTYTEEGNLKTTIKLPEGHKAWSAEFHYVICKIIILTYFEETNSYFLHCFSETGERETSKFLCTAENDKYLLHPRIKSHPSGLAAVVRNRIIIFI